MDLIPTSSKQKLPVGFSYPIGAERISSAVRDVPQFGLFQLFFSWRDEFWASRYATKMKSNGAVEVLVVEKTTIWPDWSFRIHAVPSAHALRARSGLDVALPQLREALLEVEAESNWFRFVVAYDLARAKVAVQWAH
ncbi:hypothetical protein [Dokdonella ginsengisoli]|uniref:Uncharacterized protein n=1 Tax=Dokdonella ginsengisoli TaxID=363846 RepID=A0ABV9QVS6_9GAMM